MTPTDAQINAALDLLRAAGYVITCPALPESPLETPKEFLGRLGFSNMHFIRRVADPDCPWFYAERGPSGRLLSLRSNPELEAFLQPRKGARKTP